jgi:hypothetical protein
LLHILIAVAHLASTVANINIRDHLYSEWHPRQQRSQSARSVSLPVGSCKEGPVMRKWTTTQDEFPKTTLNPPSSHLRMPSMRRRWLAIPRIMPSGSKKGAKRNVDTRGSLCTISTTFQQTVNASTHLNPGPFTEHGSFDRKMRSENHTPRPCAPDQLCAVNMDQNLCLVYYVQVQTFLEGSISRSLPRFTGLIRLSACMEDHCHLSDDPRNTTTFERRRTKDVSSI